MAIETGVTVRRKFSLLELIKKRRGIVAFDKFPTRGKRHAGYRKLGKKLRFAFELRLPNRILAKRNCNRYSRSARSNSASYVPPNNYNRTSEPKIHSFRTFPSIRVCLFDQTYFHSPFSSSDKDKSR